MELSKIKMAGFKSFVDPTTINLPSNLVAVVGPNGCGKSNIIDAVTWVMGESSPKYLRGESLTDVIFNGSTARKPVGQASVELIFDNSDGTVGGEYANYSEISVKRQINRESDSTYYLNGSRCRKKDVVALFLGTGLGPRSYSIIGQNMISRVIEAKPEELRTYLEEAAGISKYKERRRETELRIQHTKENVARVNDLRAELEKQLSHLKHQANTAEKFKSLKQQERVLRAELYAIEWRTLDSKMVDAMLKIKREETALEARNSELAKTDREVEQLRHEQRVAHDAYQEIQRRYYAVGNEITRIEQEILHHQERQQQWESDLKQTEENWQVSKTQLAEIEDSLQGLAQEIETVEPQSQAAKQAFQQADIELTNAEEVTQQLQRDWDEFNQQAAKIAQTAQVEKTRIEHLEQKITTLHKRREQLAQDEKQYNFAELDQQIADLVLQVETLAGNQKKAEATLANARSQSSDLQQVLQTSHRELDRVRSELQKLRGQQASLEALQKTALGKSNSAVNNWMIKHQLADKPRLAQHIQVSKGWELAVEKVLGNNLQAICVENINEVSTYLDDFKGGNLSVVSTEKNPQQDAPGKGERLLNKIKSPWSLKELVSGVYTAETFEEAIKCCENLDSHESVVTKDGIWMTRSWLKILREEDPAQGVFEREEELKSLASQISTLERDRQEIEQTIADARAKSKQLEQEINQYQQELNQHQAQHAQVNAQRKMKQERHAELQRQLTRYEHECKECEISLEDTTKQLAKSRQVWNDALVELEQDNVKREKLTKHRDDARTNWQLARDKASKAKEHVHELDVRLQKAKSELNAIKQNSSHLQTQISSLNERKIALQGELSSMAPIETIKKSLTRALDKHVNIEVELNTARVAAESLDQENRNLEEKRQIIERDINKVRNALESLRVEWQGFKVKAETLLEQLKETEFKLEDILQQLSQDITAEEWSAKLDQVVQRIHRLGAINLMAIEEYATCQERKQYLDEQLNDLNAGLATLEDAIAKIDKETRVRFKETFDKVNARFQELFPTIFGGGKAYLELTGDNLLEAGVTMMACPPGKRNSSVYLLSGGEKSLTAIALIFSIFYLNPAPFCLLDEVDAALDDANVLRFVHLVKVMSEKTQFIFISHNKITIETGQHLIGVTMNEPGVSRLVSVDIEKAMTLAGNE